jgi:hypothetical protein
MQSINANSELFKETDDEALDKNTYEIRFCELISASLGRSLNLQLKRSGEKCQSFFHSFFLHVMRQRLGSEIGIEDRRDLPGNRHPGSVSRQSEGP